MGIPWDIMVINVDLGPLPIGFVKRNLAVFSSSGTLQNTIPVKPMFNGYVVSAMPKSHYWFHGQPATGWVFQT